MAIFDGKGYDNHPRTIGGTHTYQVESSIIIALADNEVAGIGAIGANMEELFLLHRWYLSPRAPATNAMAADDMLVVKMAFFRQSAKDF